MTASLNTTPFLTTERRAVDRFLPPDTSEVDRNMAATLLLAEWVVQFANHYLGKNVSGSHRNFSFECATLADGSTEYTLRYMRERQDVLLALARLDGHVRRPAKGGTTPAEEIDPVVARVSKSSAGDVTIGFMVMSPNAVWAHALRPLVAEVWQVNASVAVTNDDGAHKALQTASVTAEDSAVAAEQTRLLAVLADPVRRSRIARHITEERLAA